MYKQRLKLNESCVDKNISKFTFIFKEMENGKENSMLLQNTFGSHWKN